MLKFSLPFILIVVKFLIQQGTIFYKTNFFFFFFFFFILLYNFSQIGEKYTFIEFDLKYQNDVKNIEKS